MKRIICLMSFILVVVMAFTACKNNNKNNTQNGKYTVYYYNLNETGLETEKHDVQGNDTETIARNLFKTMKTTDENHKSVIPGNLSLNDCKYNERVLYMYFSGAYTDMNKIQEIMFRAAVVKTMNQIKNVDYVSFYIKDQPLTNSSGNLIGLMAASSFIDDTDGAAQGTKWQEITVYYGDEKGEKLIGQTMSLAYSTNSPIEQVVIKKLIEGPGIKECTATVPSDLKLLNVSIKDGTCYVNFDASFLNSIANVSADVMFYSIVNTLCEINTVNRVQILVNGSSDYIFREKYALSSFYERNLDIVAGRYVVPNK